MKICSTCKLAKDPSEFNKNKRKKDGLQTICRECHKKSSKDHYGKNKTQHKNTVYQAKLENIRILKEYSIKHLSSHPCVDCGEPDIVVLEYDHVRGVKRANISFMIQHSYSLDSLIEEIAKCDVRCANCHKRKSAKQLGYYKTKMGR